MKSHQRALREWVENRIRFSTWFSKNTIHSCHVFDTLCREHLRGGPVADKVIWYRPTDVHDTIMSTARNLRRNGLQDARIDTLLDGFFNAQNLLPCANDADVLKVLAVQAAIWKQEGRK